MTHNNQPDKLNDRTSKGMWKHNAIRTAFVLAGMVLLQGCGSMEEDFVTIKQKVIVGLEDWSPWNLNEPRYTKYPAIKVGARGVFRLSMYKLAGVDSEPDGCTGFMVDDEHFVTAHHCMTYTGLGNVDRLHESGQLHFAPKEGSFGTPPFGDTAANEFQLKRFEQLGLGDVRTTGQYRSYSNGEDFSRECGVVFNGADGTHSDDRDQMVVKCPATRQPDKDGDDVWMPLGSIWGHLSMTKDHLKEGDVGIGTWLKYKESDPDNERIHWSAGSVVQDGPISRWSNTTSAIYRGERGISADALPGSSGGPFWSRDVKAVLGLIVAEQEAIDMNYYSPLLDEIRIGYREFNPWYDPLDHTTQADYNLAEANERGFVTLKCNDDKTAEELPEGVLPNSHMAAVGVFGSVPLATSYTPEGEEQAVGMTSLEGQNVSNFGLICAPYYDHTREENPAAKKRPRLQTARYTVLGTGGLYPRGDAGSDHETSGINPTDNADYVRYMHKNYEQQELHCKPGYYLHAIKYKQNETGIGAVTAILCKNPRGDTDSRTTNEVRRGQIGTNGGSTRIAWPATSNHIINVLTFDADWSGVHSFEVGSIKIPGK